MLYIQCFCCISFSLYVFFFKQRTAYELRISGCSSDVCSSDLKLDDHGATVLHPSSALSATVGSPKLLGLATGMFRVRSVVPCSSRLFEIGRASCRERVCQYV